MINTLLSTKFYIPSVRSSVVKRARLIEKLNNGIGCKLTLISAPAGFGKTTLLSEWIHQTKKSICWLSLDEGDNDLKRFFTYFIAALQQTHKNIEFSTSMLDSIQFTNCESFLIPLINEIAKLKQDILLVLDDYHLITNKQIHSSLTFLLEHLPPQLHLIIASRVEPPLPLARLRASNQLIEIRGTDLHFSDTETALFFNQVMKLSLTSEQIEEIHARTEGWISGLQLAALSMRDADDISKFIESFKGTQRSILDYLVEEVLERQPQLIQSFLLKTSILEQMCDTLVEAVLGSEINVDETSILEYLENCNLFIVPLDGTRQWYRYHHLFRELLYHLLKRREPQSVLEYHRRAAEWYDLHFLAPQAIEHAIACQEFLLAADLIEKEIQSSNNPRFEAAKLQTWLNALPHEMVWTRPWLLLSYMWALYSLGQFVSAAVAFQSIELLLKQQHEAKNEILWGLVTAFKGVLARATGEVRQSSALIEQGLQQLPKNDSWLRAMVLLNLGVTYFVADNFAAASQLLPQVTKIGQALSIPDPAIAPLYLQAQFLAQRGQMELAMHYCQQGVDLAQKRDWLSTYAGVLVKVAYAELLREQNQLETAAQHLAQSIERGILAQQPGLMMAYITLARVQQAQGNSKAAWESISCAEQCQTWMWPTILSIGAMKVRLNLAQGNLDEAIAWASNSGLSVDGELRYSFTDLAPCGSELDYLTKARVLLARGRMEKQEPYLDDAMRLLNRLYNFATSGGRTARVIEILILQALVWQARADIKKALNVLETAINIPHQGKYIRIFLDEGEPIVELLRYAASTHINPKYTSLLTACGLGDEKSAVIEPLIEPLSERELEVLYYLATGLSNQAIAEKLFVSLAAVKWHARNIYGKLNASNRTEAVHLARKLEILKP